MARKRSDRLQTLLKLAALREQVAVRQLAASTELLQQAKLQRQQLADYESDYQKQFMQSREEPVQRSFLVNFHGFFRQLEHAQLQQEAAIGLRGHEREQARLRWVDLYARRRLLSNVRERWLLSEASESDKKVQREFDDRAAQRLARGHNNPAPSRATLNKPGSCLD